MMAADTDPRVDPKLEPRSPGSKPKAPGKPKPSPKRGPGGHFLPKDGKPRGARATDAAITENLNALIGAAGVAVSIRDQVCGPVILSGGPALTDALVVLSHENAGVRRSLEALTTVSAVGGVIVAAAAIGIPIAAHHGLVPASIVPVMAGLTGQPITIPEAPHEPAAEAEGAAEVGSEPAA